MLVAWKGLTVQGTTCCAIRLKWFASSDPQSAEEFMRYEWLQDSRVLQIRLTV